MKAETLLPLGKLDPGLRAPDTPLDLRDVAQESAIAEKVGYHAILMEETKDDPFQVRVLSVRQPAADGACAERIATEQQAGFGIVCPGPVNDCSQIERLTTVAVVAAFAAADTAEVESQAGHTIRAQRAGQGVEHHVVHGTTVKGVGVTENGQAAGGFPLRTAEAGFETAGRAGDVHCVVHAGKLARAPIRGHPLEICRRMNTFAAFSPFSMLEKERT